MLLNANIRQKFTLEEVNLEKQIKAKEILSKKLKACNQSLRLAQLFKVRLS